MSHKYLALVVALTLLVGCTTGSGATPTPLDTYIASTSEPLIGSTVTAILTSEAASNSLKAKVDQVFAMFDRPDSPGCALGVIQDGQFIYKRGYGMANLEHNIPIRPSSIFRIGSTSKQFTAAAILLLAEEGKLSLDDDIRTYLEFPDYGTSVTIRHLLHHTSGIPDYLRLSYAAGYREDDYVTVDEVIAMLASQEELEFEPGEEHRYSNSGYFLLAQIVRKRVANRFGSMPRKRSSALWA